ncbi:hypothetical protein V2A60_008534 [Cordyceps javanica]
MSEIHSMRRASNPYHEPDILIILIQSSFLVLLNVVNFLLDKVIYCGLLGQVFTGVAWGTPGANWIGANAEETIVQLGYLGLLLLVYEGGLSTSLPSVRANLVLSLAVAATGIGLPIGLSYLLRYVIDATPLQCFTAGAALSSTSLGTTFTVLSTSGLAKSRLGVVLTSAAMMDDVIGLVMVQIISNLGPNGQSFDAIVVVRPLLVSLAFAVVAPLVCVLGVSPVTIWLNACREKRPRGYLNRILQSCQTPIIFHLSILVCYIAAASYAGTSNLFAAYIAGASISWWDSEVPHAQPSEEPEASNAAATEPHQMSSNIAPVDGSGLAIYDRIFAVTASIGFSIPITEMFTGEIAWKGLVYTIFMMLGKLFCGVWLLRLPVKLKQTVPKPFRKNVQQPAKDSHASTMKYSATDDIATTIARDTTDDVTSCASGLDVPKRGQVLSRGNKPERIPKNATTAGVKPRSLYPASILGCAMIARGEIGFLIASIAESKGIFTDGSNATSNSKIYLCINWAIMLCTVAGPLAVGLLVQRIRRLQRRVETSGGRVMGDVLGDWGVE